MQENSLRAILRAVLWVALLFALLYGGTAIAAVYGWKVFRFDADYRSYAGEFDLVAEYVLSLYPDTEEHWVLFVRREKETKTAALYDDGGDLLLPEEAGEALYTLSGAFPSGASLSYLWVGEGRVEFHPDAKPYALTYSPSGRPKGERFAHVRHIKGAWYHVCF